LRKFLILLLVFVVIVINGIVFNVMEDGHNEITVKPAEKIIENK